MPALAWDSKAKAEQVKARESGAYVREHDCPYYNTARWHKLARIFRARPENCLCAECKKNGIIKEAEVVDHIVPWPICKDYFFDESNLQGLCKKCNHDKGQRDKAIIQKWKQEQANTR